MRRLQRPSVRKRRSKSTACNPALWLFDLDNTLHDASYKIFPKINVGMTAAVMETLGVDELTANHLRTKYWKRYGATMIGMVKHHQINPERFLRRSHDFDVGPLIRAEKHLARKLTQLPGRKILVTNAPFHYAYAVMKHLGILRCFDGVWAIEHMRLHGHFHPKPAPKLMRHILAHEGVSAHRAVLVEDTLTGRTRGWASNRTCLSSGYTVREGSTRSSRFCGLARQPCWRPAHAKTVG